MFSGSDPLTYTKKDDSQIERPTTSGLSRSYTDLSMNVNPSNFSDSSSLDLETKSGLEEDMSLATDSSLQGINENEQVFFSSSSSDVSGDDWEEYQDCEEYSIEEGIQTCEKTESPLNVFKKMSHVIMFPESQLSTRDVSLMVMAFSVRFHLTYEARDALFEMCKLFAGDRFKTWNTSKYVMSQLYDPPDEVTKLCFLCDKCCKPLLPPVSRGKFKTSHVKCTCGL